MQLAVNDVLLECIQLVSLDILVCVLSVLVGLVFFLLGKYWLPTQSNRDPKLLTWLFNKLLARSSQRVQDVVRKVVLVQFSLGIVIVVRDVILDLVAATDVLFEVLPQEHEHVLRLVDVLRDIDHKDYVIFTHIHECFADVIFVNLGVKVVKGRVVVVVISYGLDIG